ncbi:40S ribosomal protein S3 [Cucumispora dikerogammari]|nr:40S ribosomal protein S3 [Cucumispora dikerogammari]
MKQRSDDPLITEYVNRGLLEAELHDYLLTALRTECYSHLKIDYSFPTIYITITATNVKELLGENRTKFNQINLLLTKRIQKHFNSHELNIELFVKANGFPQLCPTTQAEFIRSQMSEGVSHRRAVQLAIKNIMRHAQGCMIVVKGKLKGQRARAVKTIKGIVLHAGNPVERYVKKAQSTLFTKTGLIGIQVVITLPNDKEGEKGPLKALDDKIVVH